MLQRLGAMAAMLGGVLIAIGWIMGWQSGMTEATSANLTGWMLLIGHMVFGLGFVGIWLGTQSKVGSAAAVGVAILVIANSGIVGQIMEGTTASAFPRETLDPTINLLMTVGALLLAWDLFQSKAMPQISVGMLALGAILIPVGFAMGGDLLMPPIATLGAILVGVAVAWMGWEALQTAP